MNNLWNRSKAAGFAGDLAQRVYSSRLIGRDPSLVLHGGGNTSVKTIERNVFGEDEAVLYVKGSGWDLATIEPQGFSPCRMTHLLRLSCLESLPDLRMAAELKGCMTDPAAPSPSVEAILHAVLPARFVDHTHADALLSLCNTPDGEERVREAYGGRVVVIPYVMPGFKLARACAALLGNKMAPETIGVVLMSHGLLSFGDTAESSYARMVELATFAEQSLAKRTAWTVEWPAAPRPSLPVRSELALFRRDLSAMMGAPCVLSSRR